MRVMGVDIVKGNPLSKTNPPHYSVVIIDEFGKVLYEALEVPLRTVVRLAWDYGVSRLGIDNVFELAPTRRDLAKVLELFPSTTSIYQVTMEGDSFVSLSKRLAKLGIEQAPKPRPLLTAYLCALLALKGVGTAIRGLETRTKITVSRARSTGPGGASANRFQRGMRTAVLRAAREIKKILDEARIPYDVAFRRGAGGLESATFVVYGSSESVRKLIKPFHGNDVRVTIKPLYSSAEVAEGGNAKRPLVLGIDPGIETGIATVDLSLTNVFVTSSRELDRVEIISRVYSLGTPVLVATDKNPPPEAVKKVASALGLPLYVPPESLSVGEKGKLIEWLKRRGVEVNIRTTHERDALAAALKAYKNFERKFAELECKIDEMGLEVDVDELKLMLIRGHSIDEILEKAIEEHLNRYYTHEPPHALPAHHQIPQHCEDKLRALEDRVRELSREREVLRSKVAELENKLSELEFALRFRAEQPRDLQALRDRALNELRERVRHLQHTAGLLQQRLEEVEGELRRLADAVRGVAEGRLAVVPCVKELSPTRVASASAAIRGTGALVLEGPITVVTDSVLRALRDLGAAVIVTSGCDVTARETLMRFGVPVYCGTLDAVRGPEGLIFVERALLDEAVRKAVEDLEEYRRREQEPREGLSLERLLEIIEEYRKEITGAEDSP